MGGRGDEEFFKKLVMGQSKQPIAKKNFKDIRTLKCTN